MNIPKGLSEAIAEAINDDLGKFRQEMAQRKRDKADAERYRKMRRQAFGGEPEPWQAEEFDAAIDAEDA